MKQTNLKIPLIVAGIIVLAMVGIHYAGVMAVTECYQYFSSVDGDDDPMHLKTRFDFYEYKSGVWVDGGSYTILGDDPIGMRLYLKSDTQYKAVPVAYDVSGWVRSSDDWVIPREKVFYGCRMDVTFVWEEIICTPGVSECEGDVLYTCNSKGTEMTSTTCAYGCSGGACNPPPPVPCVGLPECNSGDAIFQECCDNKVWQCIWSNYDGNGYRMQWEPEVSWTCDADCVCDGAAVGQDCWCEDNTPDCSGLGICSHGTFMCDDCCGGDVWECTGHYKWTLKESCTADETCECIGDECLDCDCTATATPTPTPSPANIDDGTDTLTFDKSSYQFGDTVGMYATGTNIGGEEWHGKVTFTITQPDGTEYIVEESGGVNVMAGSSATADESFVLPTTGQTGTWTAQSMWIRDDGVIDARSSILDLGESASEDYAIWVIGGIAIFLLLIYLAYRKKR